MALVQQITDGQIYGDKYNTDKDAAATKDKSTDDTKQMFLKLLVTEMQYQDPLQPTDNSEYVKEMATFSQVEAVNAIKSDMTAMQANTLVGQCVTVLDENDKEVTGIVDYITKDNPPMLSVDGNLYSIEKIQSVQEPTYYEATQISQTFTETVGKLPSVDYLTLSDKTDVENAGKMYDSMTDYQKTFVDDGTVTRLKGLVEKMNQMVKTQEETEAKKKQEAQAAASTTNTTNSNNTTNTTDATSAANATDTSNNANATDATNAANASTTPQTSTDTAASTTATDAAATNTAAANTNTDNTTSSPAADQTSSASTGNAASAATPSTASTTAG